MFHDNIKSIFSSAVQSVVSKISDFAVRPGKDFTRRKKFPADKLLAFLVAEGSSSTKNELLDFFDFHTGALQAFDDAQRFDLVIGKLADAGGALHLGKQAFLVVVAQRGNRYPEHFRNLSDCVHLFYPSFHNTSIDLK